MGWSKIEKNKFLSVKTCHSPLDSIRIRLMERLQADLIPLSGIKGGVLYYGICKKAAGRK